jgi:urease accessory protein
VNQINIAENKDTLKSSWHGSLNLEFACCGEGTKVIKSQGKAPLKVQRPFYPEGKEVCHSVILHTAGGVVGGDRLSLNLHLQPNTHALITSAAAGKIYRSNGLEARQTVEMQVEAGACLEWLPQENIIFNDANYRQDLRVELATNATWMGWEITRLGRTARGEEFLQGNWRSHTEIWRQGDPIWIDRQWIPGKEEVIYSPHGLAGYPVIASFAFVGKAVSKDLIEKARTCWQAGEYQGESGVTTLLEGMLCRYRGFSTLEARSWFIEVWKLLRLSYINKAACLPRVWQI